jgi:ABC-type proline/glycine betaine transport system ATPase subunit
VARALAADPSFLLMDEPFGALDLITRAELQREFRALQQRLGKTVVFVTHDLREALLLGTRIALYVSAIAQTVFRFTRNGRARPKRNWNRTGLRVLPVNSCS